MKISIKRMELLRVLNIASQAIPVKSAESQFLNFLIDAKEDEIVVIASDQKISCKIEVAKKDAEGNDVIFALEPGKIQIPARLLLDIVSKLGGDLVTMTMVDTNYLNISDDLTNYNIKTTDGEEYPEVNFAIPQDGANGITVSIADLKKLYDATSFAVATKGPRDFYYGINVQARGGKLYFVATDSYRLARFCVQDQSEDTSFSFNCPVKALQMVTSLPEKNDCTIYFDEQAALFQCGGTIVSTRLIRGELPNPDKLIPDSFPYTLTVSTDEFLKACDRIRVITLSDDKNSQVKLTINKDDGVVLSATSSTLGNSQEHLKQVEYVMPDNETVFEIGFNVIFVTDAVKALKSDKVTFTFTSPFRLFMVKNDNPDMVQIVVPVRS